MFEPGLCATEPAQPLHVFVVQPHAMRRGETRAEQAELVEVAGQGGAVFLETDNGLHFRFRHMHLHTDIVLAREVAAGDQEFVRAMQRNRRRQCRPHPGAVMRPFGQQLLAGLDAGHMGRHAHAFHRLAQRARRDGLDQAGNRLEEGSVGHHRGDRHAHAGVAIGLRHGRHVVDAGLRHFGEHVVGHGAALADHFRRADQRRHVVVLGLARPAAPRRAVEQKLEVPAVAGALGQVGMRVGMRIDQAGDNQLARGVDHVDGRVDRLAGRQDVLDRVAVDDDVGALAVRAAGIEKKPAAKNLCGHGVDGTRSLRVNATRLFYRRSRRRIAQVSSMIRAARPI
jgi:hypothetical protein